MFGVASLPAPRVWDPWNIAHPTGLLRRIFCPLLDLGSNLFDTVEGGSHLGWPQVPYTSAVKPSKKRRRSPQSDFHGETEPTELTGKPRKPLGGLFGVPTKTSRKASKARVENNESSKRRRRQSLRELIPLSIFLGIYYVVHIVCSGALALFFVLIAPALLIVRGVGLGYFYYWEFGDKLVELFELSRKSPYISQFGNNTHSSERKQSQDGPGPPTCESSLRCNLRSASTTPTYGPRVVLRTTVGAPTNSGHLSTRRSRLYTALSPSLGRRETVKADESPITKDAARALLRSASVSLLNRERADHEYATPEQRIRSATSLRKLASTVPRRGSSPLLGVSPCHSPTSRIGPEYSWQYDSWLKDGVFSLFLRFLFYARIATWASSPKYWYFESMAEMEKAFRLFLGGRKRRLITSHPPATPLRACDYPYIQDNATAPCQITTLCMCERLSIDNLREGVLHRWVEQEYKLRSVLDYKHGQPCWRAVDPFNIEDHVEESRLSIHQESDVYAAVSDLASDLLPRDKPLWKAVLIQPQLSDSVDESGIEFKIQGGITSDSPLRRLQDISFIVLVMHHSIADGVGLCHSLASKLFETPPTPVSTPVAKDTRNLFSNWFAPWMAYVYYFFKILWYVAGYLVFLVFWHPPAPTFNRNRDGYLLERRPIKRSCSVIFPRDEVQALCHRISKIAQGFRPTVNDLFCYLITAATEKLRFPEYRPDCPMLVMDPSENDLNTSSTSSSNSVEQLVEHHLVLPDSPEMRNQRLLVMESKKPTAQRGQDQSGTRTRFFPIPMLGSTPVGLQVIASASCSEDIDGRDAVHRLAKPFSSEEYPPKSISPQAVPLAEDTHETETSTDTGGAAISRSGLSPLLTAEESMDGETAGTFVDTSTRDCYFHHWASRFADYVTVLVPMTARLEVPESMDNRTAFGLLRLPLPGAALAKTIGRLGLPLESKIHPLDAKLIGLGAVKGDLDWLKSVNARWMYFSFFNIAFKWLPDWCSRYLCDLGNNACQVIFTNVMAPTCEYRIVGKRIFAVQSWPPLRGPMEVAVELLTFGHVIQFLTTVACGPRLPTDAPPPLNMDTLVFEEFNELARLVGEFEAAQAEIDTH